MNEIIQKLLIIIRKCVKKLIINFLNFQFTLLILITIQSVILKTLIQ